jgi:hypothetical protein
MEQLIKASSETGNYSKYLCKCFPHLSKAKIKEGFLIGSGIRKLMFLLTMTEVERET